MFKGIANLAGLMRHAQQLGGRVQEINAQLRTKRVTGSAGGGLVEVEANGLGEIVRLTIDPTLVANNERDMIEDLVPAATNQAIAKAKEMYADSMKSLAGNLDLPGLDQAIASFTGSTETDNR